MASSASCKNHSCWATMTRCVLVLAALIYATTSQAQESPNPLYQTEPFDETADFRQDVCDREAAFARGEYTSLGKALQGLELRALVGINDFFQLDNDGRIYADYPGIVVTLMDEIAQRGGFTWRNSFAIVDESNPLPDDKDWTDFLIWQVDSYDIALSYWFETVERKRNGANFVESWVSCCCLFMSLSRRRSQLFDCVCLCLNFPPDSLFSFACTFVPKNKY